MLDIAKIVLISLVSTFQGQAENPKSKLYVVDFYASWCGPCIKMDREVWSNPIIEKELQSYFGGFKRPGRIDVDLHKDISRQYNVNSIPTIIIMDRDGKEIKRFTGGMTVEQLRKFLE